VTLVQYTYPFFTVRSLSPHSTTSNLRIFHSFSYSFLLVAGGISFFIFPRNVMSQDVRALFQKRRVFMPWKDSGLLASRTQFCGTPGHRSLKQIELRLSRKNRDEWDFCVSGNILPAQQPLTGSHPSQFPLDSSKNTFFWAAGHVALQTGKKLRILLLPPST